MKSQRLDYTRFAELLSERGLVDAEALQHILQQGLTTGELFPEVLVRESLIADWELSRVVCDSFQIVFLSVDVYEPSPQAVALCDPGFLHQHCLVPLDVYEDLVTVAMPALTPSEVLNTMAEKLGKKVQPVVGTVASNRNWLNENLQGSRPADRVAGALPSAVPDAAIDDEWSQLFDEGDAAVLMDLGTETTEESDEEKTIEAAELGDLSDLGDLDDLLA